MYEESIRVPLIISCPDLYGRERKVIEQMALNIDIAPTIIEAAGLPVPDEMQGTSLLDLPSQSNLPFRQAFLYEYFWEPSFPETPTCLGVRTDRYKYIRYHGIWDTNELYDLHKDPREMHNLLSTSRRKVVTPDPGYRAVYERLCSELNRLIEETGARSLPSWAK
jgi:N-acetylglucosamine-6-sulfatase